MSSTLTIPFEFHYKTEKPVPIPDIVMSLQALEKVVKSSVPVLNYLVPECDLKKIDLYVSEIKTGSLDDKFWVNLIFGSEEGKNRWIENVRRITGMEAMSEKTPIFGPVIIMALLFGAGWGASKMFGGDAQKMHIEGDNNIVIQTCAEELSIPEATVREALTKFKNKSHLASNACKVIYPAKGDPEGMIVIDDRPELKISNEAVRETPARMTRMEPETDTRTLTNQLILVRAMDLDNPKKGWACTIPGICETRIKLEVAPSVNAAALMHSDGVNVDITLDVKYTEEGDEVFKKGYVERICQ